MQVMIRSLLLLLAVSSVQRGVFGHLDCDSSQVDLASNSDAYASCLDNDLVLAMAEVVSQGDLSKRSNPYPTPPPTPPPQPAPQPNPYPSPPPTPPPAQKKAGKLHRRAVKGRVVKDHSNPYPTPPPTPPPQLAPQPNPYPSPPPTPPPDQNKAGKLRRRAVKGQVSKQTRSNPYPTPPPTPPPQPQPNPYPSPPPTP